MEEVLQVQHLARPGSSAYRRERLSTTCSLSPAREVCCSASGKRKGPLYVAVAAWLAAAPGVLRAASCLAREVPAIAGLEGLQGLAVIV